MVLFRVPVTTRGQMNLFVRVEWTEGFLAVFYLDNMLYLLRRLIIEAVGLFSIMFIFFFN